MKLLIVDDEELTRTGVIASIDWKSLGIDEVFQADDGVNGLETARIHKPEIILCDVRMPRMDGITMLERVEKFLPDSVPIFMSGYSDKEYLKAAIKLKAVNYIEKPLNPVEIQAAVKEAIHLFVQKQHSHRGESLQSLEKASRLALELTKPKPETNEIITELSSELNLTLDSNTYCTVYLVKTDLPIDLAITAMEELYKDFCKYLAHQHIDCIYIEKKSQYLVYFLFSQIRPSSRILQDAGNYLKSAFTGYGKFFLTQGDVFCGISKVYQAYTSAVILLQSSFFFEPNMLLTSEFLQQVPNNTTFSDETERIYSECLSHGDQKGSTIILEQLFQTLHQNHRYMQNPVRDLYYRLFLSLEEAYHQQKLSLPENRDSIAEIIEKCFCFQDLHKALAERTTDFFQSTAKLSEENSTIFMIKDYISKNYMEDSLSVKDISAHVFLSASYVCTFFKNETGQTLNQYLTEYRMEKAKQLLKNGRFKISDISSRVGYSDGNYFGKSFKKYSGLSPSEYREKNLK